ncbi:hypothetical protein [Paracoccus sp. (in: a-proteobacteria)]|uniref:hypothetical protein n=1 Tax=Paracoccus sp. TaxID=267 RepID=UPI00396C9560
MTEAQNKPLSLAARKRSAEADAVLDQMYGYYTRSESPRVVISDLDAQKAA